MSYPNLIPLPPIELLDEMLIYDPEAGLLYWKHRPLRHFATVRAWSAINSRQSGEVAGCLSGHGYVLVGIATPGQPKRRIYGHRIAWAIHYRHDPIGFQIDHINGHRSDNRVSNLRLATVAENQRNQAARSGSSSFRGVSFRKDLKIWRAYIFIGGKQKTLGVFPTEIAAAEAYDAVAIRTYGQYARLNFPP